jgi:hypothetical protein
MKEAILLQNSKKMLRGEGLVEKLREVWALDARVGKFSY